MLKLNSIRAKLLVYLTAGFVVVFFLFSYFGETFSKKFVYESILSKSKALAAESELKIESILHSISSKPKSIALLYREGVSIKRIEKLMMDYVKSDKNIYGMAFAFVPGYLQGKRYFCPYFYSHNRKVMFKNLIPPLYNYTKFEWFYKPLKEKKALWSEPYFDKNGGEIWMSTYSVPVFSRDGKVIAIATADASIRFLTSITKNIKILKTGRAFILSSTGKILTPVDSKYRSVVSAIGAKTYKGNGGFEKVVSKDGVYFVYKSRLKGTSWEMCILFPESELFASVGKLKLYFALITVIGIVFLFFIVFLIAQKTTKDIDEIKNISLKIANGNFDVDIPKQLSSEAKSIGEALSVMQMSLKNYMKKVQESAKIEKELELARKIQEAFVPRNLKVEYSDAVFSAKSEWARRVGGDFYGVKRLENNKVLFYLGDVSGKGIPAALYAVIARSFIELISEYASNAEEILTLLNKQMMDFLNNRAFITVFLGMLDFENNVLFYSNAGHIPPFLCKDNRLSCLDFSGDVPIGAFDSVNYRLFKCNLKYIDRVIVFSDGLSEARNENDKIINLDTVSNMIFKNCSSNDLVQNIFKELFEFMGGADLYDDTTVLEVRIKR